jgi:hypothetical protein
MATLTRPSDELSGARMPAVTISRVKGLFVPTGRRNDVVRMDGIYVRFPFDESMRGALRQEFPLAFFESGMKRWALAHADYDHVVKFFADRGYVVIDGTKVVAQPNSERAKS